MDQELQSLTHSLEAVALLLANLNRRLRSYLLPKNLTDNLTQIKSSLEEMDKIRESLTLDHSYAYNETVNSPRRESSGEETPAQMEDPKSDSSSFRVCTAMREQPSNHRVKNEDSKEGARGPYRRYCPETKRRVLRLYEQGHNFSQISRMLNIPSKNVIRWCRNGVDRKPGAGRKVLDPEMQSMLYKWLTGVHREGRPVTVNQVREKARKMTKVPEFEASLGWFKNFCSRYGIDRDMYSTT